MPQLSCEKYQLWKDIPKNVMTNEGRPNYIEGGTGRIGEEEFGIAKEQ